MLSKTIFTTEYITELCKKTKNDPALLERVIYAFGLLESISKVELPFCFKGGTALMLLLEHPRRLSTDIDIVVEPGTDIEEYIDKAGKIFPFVSQIEQKRVGKNKIEKRHFKFQYHSPRTNNDVTILLDVVFEKNKYSTIIQKPIENEFLKTESKNLTVNVPDINNILGDKLTAFAPHTTGVRFGEEKELEIIKQLFDCASLFDEATDFTAVKNTYKKCVETEIKYRGLKLSVEDVLQDTIQSCLCIASRGTTNKEDYAYFIDGISRIKSHVIGMSFSGEIAGAYACKVLYLTAAILTNQQSLIKINEPEKYFSQRLNLKNPKQFSYLQFVDSKSYAYLAEATDLLKIFDNHI